MKKPRDIHYFWLFPKQPRIYQFFIDFFPAAFLCVIFSSSIFVYYFSYYFFIFSSSIFVYYFLFFPVSIFFFFFLFFYSSIFSYYFFIICSSNLYWNYVHTIIWISERITLCMYVCMYVGMYCDLMQCIIGTFTYVIIYVICMTIFRQTVITRLIYLHLCTCNHIYYLNINTHTET